MLMGASEHFDMVAEGLHLTPEDIARAREEIRAIHQDLRAHVHILDEMDNECVTMAETILRKLVLPQHLVERVRRLRTQRTFYACIDDLNALGKEFPDEALELSDDAHRLFSRGTLAEELQEKLTQSGRPDLVKWVDRVMQQDAGGEILYALVYNLQEQAKQPSNTPHPAA